MTEPEDYDETTEDETSAPNWRRKLEADAKAGREALARAEAAEAESRSAQRELAMRRAGIDVETPIGAMFAKAYDGENDVDLMRSEWDKLAPRAPAVPGGDQAAMSRISAAQSGGAPSGGAGHDFGAELDSIPMVTEGAYNPDYVNQVLAATQVQAAREGRSFEVSGGQVTYQKGSAGPGPVTTEL